MPAARTGQLDLLKKVGLAVALTLPLAATGPALAAAQPNILVFLVDDMGWQDTSEPFHTEPTALNEQYHTPNLEQFADAGMKFTQAYACALSSPSRISLMTGMNAARHMVTNWTLRKDKQPDWKHPEVRAADWNLNGLSPTSGVEQTVQAVTVPMLLQQAGYRTIHCGKAHFGAAGTPGEDPRNLGFDVNIAGHAAGGPGSYYGKYNFSAEWRDADRIWDVPGLEKYHGQDINLTEALTREAISAIDAAVADEAPFFLYMSHYTVHAPWEPDERFHEKHLDAGLEGLQAALASMLEGMDQSLGDLLACLERHGIDEETVVIFLSDNGCPKNLPRNKPLRGHKITPYEGGTRVPMIVKWPGVVEPNTVCAERYLIIEDFFPTLLEIAGVEKSEQIGARIDGVSFVPLLRGDDSVPYERPIFWHFPNTYDQPPYSSVRRGDWKLIYQHVTRELELYNLRIDLGEAQNLARSEPKRTAELARILGDFLRETEAGMTIDLATEAPVPYPDELPSAAEGTPKGEGS
ncbi:MAG: sulfatase [Phycisphaerales bacterium JB038]